MQLARPPQTFNSHQERFVKVPLRGRNPGIDSSQEFTDFLFPYFRSAALEGTQGGSHDNRSFVAIEAVCRQKFTHFHFDEFQHFWVFESIDLVNEDNDSLDADLASE